MSMIALRSSRLEGLLCTGGFARRGLARASGFFVGLLVVIAIASAAGEHAQQSTTSTPVRRSRATSQERAPGLGHAVLLLRVPRLDGRFYDAVQTVVLDDPACAAAPRLERGRHHPSPSMIDQTRW
jgi:hypothetical protein